MSVVADTTESLFGIFDLEGKIDVDVDTVVWYFKRLKKRYDELLREKVAQEADMQRLRNLVAEFQDNARRVLETTKRKRTLNATADQLVSDTCASARSSNSEKPWLNAVPIE